MGNGPGLKARTIQSHIQLMKLLRSLAMAMTAVAMLVGVSAPSVALAVGGEQQAPITTGQNPFKTNGFVQDTTGKIQKRAIGTDVVQPLPTIIGNIVNIILSFLGVLLLIYLIYAGFLWMTSGGDSKKADTAKTYIQNAVIGLIIILASFAISNFVITNLTAVTGV